MNLTELSIIVFVVIWSGFGAAVYPVFWLECCEDVITQIKIWKLLLLSLLFGPIATLFVSVYGPIRKHMEPEGFKDWLSR